MCENGKKLSLFENAKNGHLKIFFKNSAKE